MPLEPCTPISLPRGLLGGVLFPSCNDTRILSWSQVAGLHLVGVTHSPGVNFSLFAQGALAAEPRGGVVQNLALSVTFDKDTGSWQKYSLIHDRRCGGIHKIGKPFTIPFLKLTTFTVYQARTPLFGTM